MSKLKTRDLEWYFFSVLDKKYGNGARTNRATEKGYWKTTGKDRAVYHSTQIVGMKKTLVYHSGRAPKGQRTNWVMHEYRLVDLELGRAGIAKVGCLGCMIMSHEFFIMLIDHARRHAFTWRISMDDEGPRKSYINSG